MKMDHAKRNSLLIVAPLLFILGYCISEISLFANHTNLDLTLVIITTSTVLLASSYALLNFYSLKDNIYLCFIVFLVFSLIAIVGPHSEFIAKENFFMGVLNIFTLSHNASLAGLLWLFYIYYYAETPQSIILPRANGDKRATIANELKALFIVSAVVIILGLASLYFPFDTSSNAIISIDATSALISISFIAVLMFKHQQKTSIFLTITLISLLCISLLKTLGIMLFDKTLQATLVCLTIQVFTIMMALALRLNQQAKKRINTLRYHPSTGLPAKVILADKMSLLSKDETKGFTVLVLQPENIHELKRYITDVQLDELLNIIKTLISAKVEKSDTIISLTKQDEKIAFLEGNCFALLVNTNNSEKITALITLLQKLFQKPIEIGDLQFPIVSVFGAAQFPVHSNASTTLINCALIALKHARMTQIKWCFYHATPATAKKSISSELSLAVDLERAIKHDELEILHQPQIDLKMQRVCGSECVLRWQHHSKGAIEPAIIFAIAQDVGLISQLTLWSVKQSLSQHKEICDLGGHNHMVSINILPKDILSQGFIGKLIDVIEASEVPGDKIILALNQSAKIINNDDALSVMEQLTDIGITVSVDDFYSGYTTLANYKNLPFQELKIEGQFIQGLSGTARQKSITETTIKMAKSLALEVVAEGISSQWEQDILTKFGCDIGQGKFFSKPLSKNAYIKWLEETKNDKVSDEKYGEFIPAKKH